MKKIFSILLASMVIGLFSSCILVLPEHTLYFYNDTKNEYVYDWYLKDLDGTEYAVSSGYCEVGPGEYDYISNLKENCYQVWFCEKRTQDKDYYWHTDNYFELNSDATFYLSNTKTYSGSPRSAVSENNNFENNYVLKDSKGNVYKLVRD